MTIDAVGGVWRYGMDLGAALRSGGTEVVFACLGPSASPAQIAEAEAIGRFIAVPAPLDWTAVGEQDLAGIAHQLETMTAEQEIDLLHLNLPSQAAGLHVPVPVVVVSHSCVVTWFQAVRGTATPPDWQWQGRWNRAGFAAADAVLAPSRSHADLLTACYGPLRNLVVVHNGARSITAPSQKEPYVLAAGRWWDDGKNGRLLDAASKGAAWPVQMAGSLNGPNGQYMPVQSAQYLGEIPNAELRSLMARAAVFASPSIYEPFGLAPLEAALEGSALLLSDIPTYRELWDGAAFFAPPDDPAAWSAAIDRLAADPDLRRALGSAAAARATNYSLEAQVRAVRNVYAGLMQPAQALRRAG